MMRPTVPIAALRRQAGARRLGMFGAIAATLFLVVLIALHVLRPDISSIRDYVSDFANGPYGDVLRAASFVHGIGNVAIAAALWLVVGESPSGRWGAMLFGAAAIGVIVAALFPTDLPGRPSTPSGTTHLVAAFASFAIEAVALFLLARVFKHLPSRNFFAGTTRVLATLGSASLVLLLAFRMAGIAPGLAERSALLAFVAWELSAAVQLARARFGS